MGVYIKNMDMPTSCYDCPLGNSLCCRLLPSVPVLWAEYAVAREKRMIHSECPLIPVPPHGPLIDTNKILEHKYVTIPPHRKEYADGKRKSEDEIIAFKHGWNSAIDAIIANAPIVIEAEEDET